MLVTYDACHPNCREVVWPQSEDVGVFYLSRRSWGRSSDAVQAFAREGAYPAFLGASQEQALSLV